MNAFIWMFIGVNMQNIYLHKYFVMWHFALKKNIVWINNHWTGPNTALQIYFLNVDLTSTGDLSI